MEGELNDKQFNRLNKTNLSAALEIFPLENLFYPNKQDATLIDNF